MIVHHPARLHEGVADRRPDKFESAREERLAQRVAFGGSHRHVTSTARSIHDRLAPDKGPEERIEAAEFLLHREEGAGIPDRRGDLQSVADNARVGQQGRHLAGVIAGDPGDVEVVERAPVVVPLRENRRPAQARLGALERQAKACAQANRVNGGAIELNRNMAGRLLETLRGGTRTIATYDASGRLNRRNAGRPVGLA